MSARPLKSVLSLRSRMLAAMLGPLVGVALLIGLIGATVIDRTVRHAGDRVLGGALEAIAETVEVEKARVTLDLPAAAFGMLETDTRDSLYYRVSIGGETLTGYGDLPAPSPKLKESHRPRFRSARYRDQDIRLAEMRRDLPGVAAPVIMQLAETTQDRRKTWQKLMAALVVAEVALLAVAAVVLHPALGWSLRPLNRLRGAVVARDTRAAPDLSPLDTGGPLPAELKPLSGAFDNLLARLDAATGGVRRFTADASHQMRTPLSVLKVQVALARRGDPKALDEIADAAQRLEHLMTQLLALARADEAGVPPEREAVDLKEVARAVINRRINQAIEAGIEVTLDAPADDVEVISHRALLFEIISNLVDNAIRYNHQGGLVVISIEDQLEGPVIAVGDDGPGLPDEDLARLGERFVRLSTSRGQQGSGLGFAIVRSAVQRIGAELNVINTRPGLRVSVQFKA